MIPGDRFWAKVGPASYHPLFAHNADVAAVLERLIAPGTVHAARLAAAAGLPELAARHRATLVYLAALHDCGKVNHGFQEKKRRPPRMKPPQGHVKVLLRVLTHPRLRPAAAAMIAPLDLAPADAQTLLLATLAHHGRPWTLMSDDAALAFFKVQTGIPRDPVGEIVSLAELARRHSGLSEAPPAPPLRPTAAFTHLYAGILTLSDWLGSNEEVFRHEPDADPEQYWDVARERAKDICARTDAVARPLPPCGEGTPLLGKLFPTVFARPGRPAAPSPLQAHVAAMPVPGPGSRVLIESETGSGKTEAALTMYARLRSAGHVGGLLFALPTRATAAAMHERVCAAARNLYGDAAPHVVLAVGGQRPESGGSPLLATEPQRYDDEDAGTRSDPLTTWGSEDARRYLAAEVVVGTLDQVLLAGLPVRHAHLRLAGLARHLLVVDELHAYDTYMTALLANLLDLHTGTGGIALFMSATLAVSARHTLGGPPEPTRADAAARPYPSLGSARPDGTWEECALASVAAPKDVRWRLCGEQDWMGAAVRAAAAGARVCVLRNTVRGAREVVDALVAAGHAALLWTPRTGATPAYHSRYAPPDRAVLDQAVIARFGRGAEGAGVILVATQVAEQSLDIDFDLLITDLCPIDVLLQRIGRLWRHPERVRPAACPAAETLVIAPSGGFAAAIDRPGEYGRSGWGSVYEDLGVLELTWQLIADEPAIRIPRDNRRLVESVYHGEPRAMLESDPAWSAYGAKRAGIELATAAHAAQVAMRFGETYDRTAQDFDAAAEIALRTRLGDDRIRISLAPHQVPCRYAPGTAVDWIELPAPDVMRSGVDIAAPVVDGWSSDSGGVRFRLGQLQITYDDAGWHWASEKRQP